MTAHRLLALFAKIGGFACLGMAFFLIQRADTTMLPGDFVHTPSLMFVSLAILGVLFCSFDIHEIAGTAKVLLLHSPATLALQISATNKQLESLSTDYYSGGVKKLEASLARLKPPVIWGAVVNQIAAKIPQQDMCDLLTREAERLEANLAKKTSILTMLASTAPAVGVLGTVLGLIQLLAQLDDLSSLGPNMSLALVTTLYGLFYSVLVLKPLAARLVAIREAHLAAFEQVIFWLGVIDGNKPAFYCRPEFQVQKSLLGSSTKRKRRKPSTRAAAQPA